MKFQVDRDVLNEAVSFAARLLPLRPTIAILGGVLLEVDNSGLTLSTFDYEVSTQTKIAARVEQEGRVLVSGKLLSEITGRLPNAPVEVDFSDGRVQLKCGSATFTLLSMSVDEYPTIPQVAGESGLVRADEFSNAVAQVVVASSRDDIRPALTGVQFDISGNSLSLVATDRYRVAIKDINWESQGNISEMTALVPARTIQEIGKTFGQGENITISFAQKDERELISFSAGNKTVTSVLINGNFPMVKKLFPEKVENHAVLNTADLVEATRRVKLVVEREAALRFTFANNSLTLEAAGGDQAQASETIDAVISGPDVVVSLKPDFLLDGLNSVHSEFTRIGFTSVEDSSKPGPVLITSQTSKDTVDDTTFRYLLQPNLLLR